MTLSNEYNKNRASGPSWNGFLAAQVVLGSRIMFGTGTVAQLLAPASSGDKKSYDKHHIFPDNFLKSGIYSKIKDCRANFVALKYQKNIEISDDPPNVYVTKLRKEHGEEAYRVTCEENALPLDFENMEYPDFLKERQYLMAQLVKRAFERL